MKKKILLITRCSRLNDLDKLYENISAMATLSEDITLKWHIAFDTNIISPSNIPHALLKEWVAQSSFEIMWTYSGSNQKLYGSNIANDIINHKSNNDVDLCYLLDDDNKLHRKFITSACTVATLDVITCFGQIRLNKISNVKEVHVIDDSISPDNCIGWIDSAQFLIPMKYLKEIGGYADGYCIDGETIKILLSNNYKFMILPDICSYYNYFTELI